MMAFGLLAMTIAVMKLWPETRGARWLHRQLVEYPLDLLARATRRQILAYIVLIVMLLSLGELAMMAPMDLLGVVALDTATYVDVLLTVWTVAAVSRVKGAGRALITRLPLRRGLRIGARARRRRTKPGSVRKSANDDEDGERLAVAA